ncbi:RNA polymerase sigma factor [Caulobacter endophyticus]|uniref:RNA polymerase sigma factor n=1 Tax=Caulobacter endophyticus TaxID=2172652 RepID=UPI0024103179|nr:RNA polymerase sigma factor [Caulobacter endophyticus]MDG2527218.1 RNA polymerase sigma factor [Caulobacter endophyticus]
MTASRKPADPAAEIMAELVERFDARLRRYLGRFLVGPDVEDALQDIYLRLTRLAAGVPPPSFNATYVFKTADSVVRDLRRRRLGRGGDRHVELPDDLAHDAPSPFDEVRWQQNADLLRRAIASLTREQRMVLMMHRVEGLTLVEIAERQRIPLRTTQRLLADALGRCRHRLKDCGWFEK